MSQTLEKQAARTGDPAPPDVLVALEADFAAAGRFGHRRLEVTAERVRVREPATEGLVEYAIADIASARNEPLVGGGQLELTLKSGRVVPIIAYTASLAPRFSEAARGIEQLAKGEEFRISIKHEKTHCPKCGKMLPEKDGKCPACVSKWRVLARIARFLQPYKLRAAGLVACTLTMAALSLVPPKIQGTLVDDVLRPQKDLPLLFQLVFLWLGVVTANALITIIQGRIVAYLAAHVIADIRAAVYRAIEFLSMGFFEKRKVGTLQSRMSNDTQNIWGFLVDGLPYLLSNALIVVGIITLMALTNWFLTLCVMAPIAMVLVISGIFWKKLVGKWHRWSHKWAKFQSNLNESLSGVKVMKAFAQEAQEDRKFTSTNDGIRHAGTDADQYFYTVFGAMSFFGALGMLVLFGLGGTMVVRGQLTLGEFVTMVAYLSMIYGPLQWFAAINNWFGRAMSGAERIFEIMDTEPEKYGDSSTHHQIVGEVTFDHVRFGYDKSNPVIKGMSFTAKAGEMIGLVGKSGSGKSTTINLICRFYEPDAGSILIDGQDYRAIALQDMRQQIGVVLQEPFLFNGTLWENIAYGKPGASFEEVVEAAQAANAHSFILSKPDGYDTIVGERGNKLSGGERQRISIARAILHNPRILILDEATSSVDVETEKQIQEAIGRLIAHRTTFAIAHRLSTLRHASRLIVLDKGEIVEMGTHQELLDKQGVFYNLVKTQSATNEIIAVGNM